MSGIFPEGWRNLFHHEDKKPKAATAEDALKKLRAVGPQLESLGAHPYADDQPLIIDENGLIVQDKRVFVRVGGYAKRDESQVVLLLEPLFPQLQCIVSFYPESDHMQNLVEVYRDER